MLIARSEGDERVYAEGALIHRLKIETAAHHLALENGLNLLRPGFTLDNYLALLSRFYGFYEPWENLAFPLLASYPTLTNGRGKVRLLLEDLHFFGIAAGSLPLSAALPALSTASEAAGSLYVIEGSTLGGQILARHFAQISGVAAEGMAFFRAYGDRTGAMWKSFRQALEEGEFDSDAAVLAATRTFEALGNWLLQEDGKRE